MPALIVAFDGSLCHSLPLRAHALRDACEAEQAAVSAAVIEEALPGRTFLEAAAEVLAARATHDPTLVELVALRAQRGYRALVQHGAPFDAAVLEQMRAAHARGVRVIVRADSERRDVEPLLQQMGLLDAIALLRCSDDPPRSAAPSVERSWVAIGHRLDGLGIPATERSALEPWGVPEATARRHGAHLVTIPPQI